MTITELTELVRKKVREHPNMSELSFDTRVNLSALHAIRTNRTSTVKRENLDALCEHFGIEIVVKLREAA